METLRRLRRRWAALAGAVLLAGALMPVLAQVVVGSARADWVAVCSAQGMKWVSSAVAIGEGGAPASSAAAMDHCPFCSLGSHSPFLPAGSPALVPAEAGTRLHHEGFYAAARTSPIWCPAQARAPPARG